MKEINETFGFWVLLSCGVGLSWTGNGTGAAVCLVGAVLFNAIKSLKR